ncbi:MAG: nucleotidyltransferase [Sulfolobales archaeon]|nr:nucleotidyltransferase [Sulfolobales archaeon]MCX8208228.1 nucleotidyltransferase [Sulfolobales archaeon]MDW8011077.1 nucleotidyltransferase [Sulfolobales archaeon]
MFSSRVLSRVIDLLRSTGVDGVVIGSTSVELFTGRDTFEGDIDLLVTSTSVLANYGILEQLARERGCVLGATWLGTPSVTCYIEGEEVTVDLFENLYDFYIPSEIVEDSITYDVLGIKVRAIRVEDYVVLKAAAGRDEDLETLRKIGELVRSRKLRLDRKLIESRAELFSEPHVILRRLSEVL